MKGINTENFRVRGQKVRQTALPLLASGDRDSWEQIQRTIISVEQQMSPEEKEAFEGGLYYQDEGHQMESEAVGALLNAIISES